MRASVYIADLGAKSLVKALRAKPKPGEVPGLASAEVATCAPLRTRTLPSLSFSRVGLIAIWEDDEAIDAFEAAHPAADLMAHGWSTRLEPLRRWGSWPGLPESIPTDKAPGRDMPGPFAVLTMGRVRLPRVVNFLRTSLAAEQKALRSPGLLWATAMALPPFVATCSLWDSTKSISTFAYGQAEPGHYNAIEVGKAKPFHREEVFIRFRPYATKGGLGGKNPLPALLTESASRD